MACCKGSKDDRETRGCLFCDGPPTLRCYREMNRVRLIRNGPEKGVGATQTEVKPRMPNPKAILQWDVLLDDTEWNRRESLDNLLGAAKALPSSQTRSRSRLWLGMAATCLLVAAVAGLGLHSYATLGLNRIDAEVQDIVDTETWTQQTGKSLIAASLMDSQADRRWQEHFRRDLSDSEPFSAAQMAQGRAVIHNVALRSDLAMVALTVQGSDGTRYRQTRFYRQDENDGWLRTAPNSSFWGSAQTIETDHFRIHFRQRDERTVIGTAAHLDRIYTNLRRDAGLLPASEKLTVEVKPLSPHQLNYLKFEKNRLEVHSPLLRQAPEELSDQEILTKSIVNPLVAHVLAEALEQVSIQQQWRPMLKGLQVWQAYVGSDSLTPWYRDTAAWLYGDAPDIRSGQRPATLHDLSRLCREYVIWRYGLPGALAHPRLCTDANWALHLPFVAPAPLQLDAFLDLKDGDQESTKPWTTEWGRTVAAATVIDYLVATYGRDRLPDLMAGFRTYDSWDTLAPAVLGVTAQELETGWQAYLEGQIGTYVNEDLSTAQIDPRQHTRVVNAVATLP